MKLQKWSIALVSIVVTIAVLALTGWILEIEILRSPVPHFVTMNPVTAILFILSSFAFFLITSSGHTRMKHNLGTGIILFVFGITSYKLIQIALALPLQIDTLLFAKRISLDLTQSKLSSMAPNTAVNFVIISISLWFITHKKPRRYLYSQLLIGVVLLTVWFAILGYCYGVPEFYDLLFYFPLAIQTAACFLLFSLAILFANPKKGLMKLFTSPYSGSTSAKILVPCVIVIPFVIGYINLWIYWGGVISTEFDVAILVLSCIVIFIFVILVGTSSLNKKDIKEKLFMRRLEFANQSLQDANKKLRTSNTHLADLNQQIENAKVTIEQQAEIIIKQKNDQLEQYRQNLDIIFNNTQEAILLLDNKARVVLFNKTFKDFIENTTPKKPAIGESLYDVVPDERREASDILFQLALQGRTSRVEVNFQGPQHPFTRSLCYQPIWQNGEITHVSTTSFDITEQKKQEDVVRLSEANLKAIFENTLDSFLLLSEDYTIIAFNKGYYQAVMLQTNKALVVGKSIMDYLVTDRKDFFTSTLLRVKDGETVQYETKLGTTEEPKWFHIAITQVKGTSGEFFGYCISTHNRTDIKKAELELRRSEERFRAVVENSDDIFCLVNQERKISYASPSFTRILGYNEEDIQVMHRNQIIHPEDLQQYSIMFEKMVENPGELISITCRTRHKDGRWLWMEGTIINLFHVENINSIISTYHDVTSRYQAAKELEKLSLVASNASSAVVILDREGCIEWVNASFTKLTEYVLDEIKGIPYTSFLKQTQKSPSIINLIEDKMRHFESVSVEVESHSKSGRCYWIRLDVTPVFNEHGAIKNFVSVKSDISNQKEYENEITTIARELGSLIENSNVPIFGVDRNGYINEWNNVTSELTQMPKNDMLGKKWVSLCIEPIYQETINDLLVEILDGKSIDNFELPILTKTGERKTLLLSASPRWNADGVIKGVILVAQNITELIEYRQGLEIMVQDRTKELNEALNKEKELVEMKNKFVSVVSHEFRTPLSTISLTTGFLKRYKQKLTDDDLDQKLETIEKQVSHMNYLLEDVLVIGKAEAGKIDVNSIEINIADFFAEICSEVYNGVNKSHRIKLNIKSNKNVMISDPRMLRIITTNLLTNAAKFSPGKSNIILNISKNENMIVVEVIDEGLGIPEKDIESLFNSFHRGSNIGTIEGTGLGLTIVRKTVDLLRGSISVKSKVMEGTMFTVSIPIG